MQTNIYLLPSCLAPPRQQPEPQPVPVSEQRLQTQTTPVPDQRVPATQPDIIEDSATEMRVPVIPPPPVIQSLVQAPRVVPPNTLPSYSMPCSGLPPAQLPVLIPPSPERPVKRPGIRKTSNHPNLPRQTEHAFHFYNTRFGRAIHHIAQNLSMEWYSHRIASLATPTQESAVRQPPL